MKVIDCVYQRKPEKGIVKKRCYGAGASAPLECFVIVPVHFFTWRHSPYHVFNLCKQIVL